MTDMSTKYNVVKYWSMVIQAVIYITMYVVSKNICSKFRKSVIVDRIYDMYHDVCVHFLFKF